MKSQNIIDELWNSEAMQRLLNSSRIGFVVVSPEQKVLAASQTFCAYLEYSQEEVCQMYVSDYTHPEDQIITTQQFDKFSQSNVIQTFEKRYITKSGKIIWCKIRSEAVYDDNNDVKYRLAMIEDITKEKLDELNLKQMAAITESSDDAIFRWDTNGIIQFWGNGAERMYGFSAEDALGKHASIISINTNEEFINATLEKLSRGEVVRNPDSQTICKDGTLIDVSVVIFPIKNAQGTPVAFAAVHRDISAFKQLEIQFQHSQRLETAGLLAGGIAHDFNNIITVIQGASNLLSHNFPADGKSANHLNLIERSAERASKLTRQLLTFSRKQKFTPAIINPNELINESINILSSTIGDHITLETSLTSTWNIKEDSTQLEQVMLNLAVNSRYAMPTGGTLEISTEDLIFNGQLNQPGNDFSQYCPIKIPPGNYVLIKVKDSGCGMDKSTLEHIFDPFFTTKPKDEGTGLGLSMVYGMVTQVDGGINVISRVNNGTEIQIFLPKAEGEIASQSKQPSSITDKQSGRILVLEDDEGVRTLTSSLLESVGYTVFQAEKPADILEGKAETNVDLILSDVMMPGMSGPEFAEYWLDKHPGTNFLFMSGYFEDDVFAEKMRGKALIQKPFKPSELLETVSSILRS